MIPGFVEALSELPSEKLQLGIHKHTSDGTQNGILISEFQKLFGYMWNSNRKYIQNYAITETLKNNLGAIIESKNLGQLYEKTLNELNEVLGYENIPLSVKQELDSSNSEPFPISFKPAKQSFITSSFFGSFQVSTKTLDEEGDKIESKTDKDFCRIVVNPNETDIYKSWEMSYNHDIENFRSSSVI